MAVVCPHAEWDPLGTQTALRMARHDVVCLHTMAGTYAGTDSMFHANGFKGTESHFGVAGDGRAKQWQDLDYRADANFEGNHRVISIETADKGESFPGWSGSNVPPWTDAQLDRIVAIVRWCCDTYDIPKVLVTDSSSVRRGIGYHRQGIDGNFGLPYPGRRGVGEWWSTGDGKPCPGDARIRQLIEIVIPRVRGEEEDDMDEATYRQIVKEEIAAAIPAIAQKTHESINVGFSKSGSVIRTGLGAKAEDGVDAALADGHSLDARLDAIDAKLDALLPAGGDPAPSAG